jgi:uncharacterized small protein (DUF1192 family)
LTRRQPPKAQRRNGSALQRELALLGVRELTAALLRATAGRSRGDALFAMAHPYRAYATEYPGRHQAGVTALV